jgi:Rrf2 family iron-sulfur cluster assembly transcriptional regulator
MLLTTKGRYAVMAVVEIASNGCNEPVSLLTISQKQQISLSYLEQIFAKLKKSKIVDSVKGPGGGYILARNKNEITIADIIQAIGESIKMTRCSTKKSGCINSGSKCKTHLIWHGLEQQIFSYLNSISLQKICP